MKTWLVALVLFAPELCHEQGNEVIVQSLRANSLSGVVVTSVDGTPFAKVVVSRIECGKGEFRGAFNPVILQTVETDSNGNFAFPWKDHSRTCLQVQTLGMDTLQVEVTYAKGGGKLKPKLKVGA